MRRVSRSTSIVVLALGGLLAAGALASGARRDDVVWLSARGRSAAEPVCAVDAAGRLWALWIAIDAGKRPVRGGERREGRVEGACVSNGRVLARFVFEEDLELPAGLALAPHRDGVYCVLECGGDGARGLLGRTLALDGDSVRAGELERVPPLSSGGTPLAPSLATSTDGLLLAFQGSNGPSYDVFLARYGEDRWSAPEPVATTSFDEWRPRLAAGTDGAVHLVYDVFDGGSFDAAYRAVRDGVAGPERRIASGPDHQAQSELAVGEDGAVWIAWEAAAAFGEGGGLRGARELRLARLAGDELKHLAPLPRRVKRREFPRPVAGREGLLVTYRSPERADVKKDHLFTTWLTSTVRFDGGDATEEVLEPTDGNGGPEHDLARAPDGSVWMVFATDARRSAFAKVREWSDPIEGEWRVGLLRLAAPHGFPELAGAPPPLRSSPPLAVETTVEHTRPFFGDLHRHTHLSRCSGAQDGTLEDTYRYARGPGRLDFVAVTDHYQHMHAWSWWRSMRDVVRYDSPGRLVVFAGVERVRRGHYNDIYLVPGEVPFDPGVWKRPPPAFAPVPPEHVISIPHMMSIGRTSFDWSEHVEDRTRLFEVFQGTRGAYEGAGLPYEAEDGVEDETSLARGLAGGAHFGLVASSDHVASRAAYAGVYAGELSRDALFAALRARRTFALSSATPAARAISARLGALALGEAGDPGPDADTFRVELLGDAARDVAYVELVRDGETLEHKGGAGPREVFVLTLREGLFRSGAELALAIEGGTLADLGLRREGEVELSIARTGERSASLARSGLAVEEAWIAVEWDDAAGGALVLSHADREVRLPRAELAPGRSRRIDSGDLACLVWRQGPPLGDVDSVPFHVSADEGASFYARVAWTNGDLAWTSPIRVRRAGGAESPAQDGSTGAKERR